MKPDYDKQLITLTAIILSGFHCAKLLLIILTNFSYLKQSILSHGFIPFKITFIKQLIQKTILIQYVDFWLNFLTCKLVSTTRVWTQEFFALTLWPICYLNLVFENFEKKISSIFWSVLWTSHWSGKQRFRKKKFLNKFSASTIPSYVFRNKYKKLWKKYDSF
jgi:hypothetical protein